MVGGELVYNRRASEPFLQRAYEHLVLETSMTNKFFTLMQIFLVDEMALTNIPYEALLYIILATMKNSKTVKVASTVRCSFNQHPRLLKQMLLLRLLRPRNLERYLTSPEFEDMNLF